jgi:hypothetical protein
MKFYTPEKTVLMEITAVKPHADGLMIEGKIMGTMPMRAVLRPDELRAGFSLLSWPTFKALAAMLRPWRRAGTKSR